MKDSCYRFTAKRFKYQSFMTNPPIKQDGTCDYFWNNQSYGESKSKKKNANDDGGVGSPTRSMD